MSTYFSREAQLHSFLRNYKRKEAAAQKMLAHAWGQIESQGGYISFSGGKDSTILLHMGLKMGAKIPACFFKSDLEFPENLEYMRSLSKQWDFPLQEIEGSSVLDMFIDDGWFNHYRDSRDTGQNIHNVKILEPAQKAYEDFGPVALWGLRAKESKGRSALLIPLQGVVNYNDGRITIAPLWNWSHMDVMAYLTKHSIPANPIYTKMERLGVPQEDQRVGSIFDGANIDNGRIVWLKRGWAKEYDKLRLSLPRIEEFS